MGLYELDFVLTHVHRLKTDPHGPVDKINNLAEHIPGTDKIELNLRIINFRESNSNGLL